MRTSKKLLSFFLAVVMVVTTCSVGFTAFAQDNSNSIWSTSCEAEDAFNTLTGLADEFLPSVFMSISSSISNPIYEKYAALIGKDADNLSAHEKAVIEGTEEPTDSEAKAGLQAATIQDVLLVLQPTLLGLFGTSQDKYPGVLGSTAVSSDPSYYDYLLKYTTDEDGNEVLDEDSMTFFALYGLCKEYRNDKNLSSDTRETLSEWYTRLSEIANIELVDETEETILKHAKAFNDAGGVEINGEIAFTEYNYATLYELERFYDDEYMAQVSDEDKAILASAYDQYNSQLQEYYSFGITIDSLAKLIYYCFGQGQDEKYIYAYYNLIHSAGGQLSVVGSYDLCDYGEEVSYNIEDLEPETYLHVLWDVLAQEIEGYDSVDAMFEDWYGSGELCDLIWSMVYTYTSEGLLEQIFPLYIKEISEGLAITYSDEVSSTADIDALVKASMPDGYENGITAFLTDDEIKEIASMITDIGKMSGSGGNDSVSEYFGNGSVTVTDYADINNLITITPTVPSAIKGTALSEYFSLIYKYEITVPYTRGLSVAFNSNYDNPTYSYDESGTLLRYDSGLPVLSYENATYSVDTIQEYINDAEDYAYSKVVADLFGVSVTNKNSTTGVENSVFDYQSYLDSRAQPEEAKVVLTDEQKEILYADYDLANEVGTELLNYILNDAIVGIVDDDIIANILNSLLDANVDLVAAIEDIWQRLCDAPVATVFELVPVLVVLVDNLLVPVLLNSEGDLYNGLITEMLETLATNTLIDLSVIGDYLYSSGSYIGIKQIGWDLNELLPDLMHWLFEGSSAEGIEYYEDSTTTLLTVETDDNGNKAFTEKIFTLANCDEIDFDNYSVADRNGNALTASFENGNITSYSYLGNTNEDLSALLADYADTEFLCTMTYSSSVPYFTGIYVVDRALKGAKISDLKKILVDGLGDETTGNILYEVILEFATLFTEAIDEFVGSDRVNQTRYTSDGKNSACSGLNNLFVAIPQLFDIMEDLAAEKYNVSTDAWTYCYDEKIYVDSESGSCMNKVVEDVKIFAGSSDAERSIDIFDWFADTFVNDWLNAILSILNNVISTDNSIINNLPIIGGLLNALGGLGETSIITDVLNGIFQIDRESEYSFIFEERENGLTGLSKDHAYFLIVNIKTLIDVILNLVDSFSSDSNSDSDSSSSSSASTSSAVYKPKAAKVANADSSSYTTEELSNAADLIDNLDKMLSSLLSDTSFNGFDLDSTENIFAGIVTFFSNYLGNDCYTDLGKLINSYVFYITGSETHTADSNGDVDAKKVYTNESLTGLVVETFLLIENVVENLLSDYYATYTLDNGSKAQYNLLVEAIEGLISPDAISVRLTGYSKVQDKLSDYNCWHNAAVQTSRGNYKIDLDWGIKAGDKDAFYDGLAASLRLVTSILGVLLIDTGWYETLVSPVLGALCTPNGITLDTVAQYKVTTNGYHDEVLLGLITPLSEWMNLFLEKPVTTLIKSIQGIAGILDDKNGATIASILKGAIAPLANELEGLGKIFAIKSDKLLPTSLTLQSLIDTYAEKLAAYSDPSSIKLGKGDYTYALTGDNLIPIINSYLASTGITLKKINWNKLSTAKTPAAALVYILEYVFEVLLDNNNLTAIAKLIGNDTVSTIIDLIKSGDFTAADILKLLNTILEATDSPTLAYWTFSQYLQEAVNGFYYPAGITKDMADSGVTNLDDLINAVFPLLSSFGLDLGGNSLQEVINKNLFTNDIITSLATALYGALDGLDSTVKDILKGLGIVTSTKDVAALLTDASYGTTFTSAAKTIKAQSSWKNVKNVNWGFTDGSAKAQQGFVNALAAVLRPFYDVLEIFLDEGTLELNDFLYDLICSLDIPYAVQVIEISDSEDTPIQLKLSYRMKDGVLRLKFREYEGNRERSKSSELRIDFTSLKDLTDLKIEGTNGYNSAIIPLLEALQCSNISTYAQYKKDVAKAKDNLLLDILNPLIGDSSSSFLNKLAANPVSELTKLLPNIALYLDSDGLVQLVVNLLAPVTYLFTDGANPIDKGLGDFIDELLGGSTADIIIPLVNFLLDSLGVDIELPAIDWDFLINLGDVTTYTSKATDTNGKYLTGKTVSNVDQGKVLVTVLRYVANILIDNAAYLKNLICSIDAIAKNDMLKSIIASIFNTIGMASADQLVAAVFYLLAGQPENAFWDYTGYKTGTYSFSYPETVDVDFLKSLSPMVDGLISGLVDLNGLIAEALFTDELISKLAVGLYGAIEGVNISDDLNLTQLLAQTDIDFSTANVSKLLVDEDYGQKFESASAVIAAAGSWSNVNSDSLKWGVTDRDSFFHALVAVLRPLYGVLDVLLNDAYLGLFDLVRLPGSNGYTSSIVPLMEAFSMYNIKTQYQYRQDMSEAYDAILLDIINPLWDLVEDVLNAPLQTVAAIIPNLALFIGNDGLCQIIDNLLTPVSALIDAIRPVVDLNDLLTTLFDALNLDLNSLLAKIGITNFSLDIYDLNKTLKPILGGDAIIPLINNILGMIEISGTALDLTLNDVDWLQLASHGTTVVSFSQAATYGSRIFVQGDSSETLIAVLRYLINTINSGDNFDKISALISSLLGDSASDNVTDMINTVLGMLQGDTDEVISQLVDLLQSLA